MNFGKIENILLNWIMLNLKGLKIKIQANKELLLRNLSIIRLEKDTELPYRLTDFKIVNTSRKWRTMDSRETM